MTRTNTILYGRKANKLSLPNLQEFFKGTRTHAVRQENKSTQPPEARLSCRKKTCCRSASQLVKQNDKEVEHARIRLDQRDDSQPHLEIANRI
jgi:hypothetical protein